MIKVEVLSLHLRPGDKGEIKRFESTIRPAHSTHTHTTIPHSHHDHQPHPPPTISPCPLTQGGVGVLAVLPMHELVGLLHGRVQAPAAGLVLPGGV